MEFEEIAAAAALLGNAGIQGSIAWYVAKECYQ